MRRSPSVWNVSATCLRDASPRATKLAGAPGARVGTAVVVATGAVVDGAPFDVVEGVDDSVAPLPLLLHAPSTAAAPASKSARRSIMPTRTVGRRHRPSPAR